MRKKDVQNRCLTCNRVLKGKKTKYCNKLCRDVHWNSRAIRKVHSVNKNAKCLQCDAPLTERQSKFCSRSCGITYRRRHDAKSKKENQGKCIVCKRELTGRQTKYCCTECNEEYVAKLKRQNKKDLQVCAYCKTLLEYGREYRRFCKRDCMIAFYQKKNGVEPHIEPIKDEVVSNRILKEREIAVLEKNINRLSGWTFFDD